MDFKTFDENLVSTFRETTQNKDLIVHLKDIDEAVFIRDLLSEKANNILTSVRSLQK